MLKKSPNRVDSNPNNITKTKPIDICTITANLNTTLNSLVFEVNLSPKNLIDVEATAPVTNEEAPTTVSNKA